MYRIHHNIDDEKITVLKNDAEFVHFMRQIAIENEDAELSITCIGEAMDYLTEYCSNLTLLDMDRDYSIQGLDNDNIKDLKSQIDEVELLGLIDEKSGDIIGYINVAHAKRIIDLLNMGV